MSAIEPPPRVVDIDTGHDVVGVDVEVGKFRPVVVVAKGVDLDLSVTKNVVSAEADEEAI